MAPANKGPESRQSMTAERAGGSGPDDLADEIARRWAGRDLYALANEPVATMSIGTPTDWGLPAPVDSAVAPVTLGGGIPDPATLPRGELLEAMRRALAVEDDGPLRYGGGVGFEPLRSALAERYTRDRGVPVDAEHFMLTNGSAGAIESVCSALLRPGDVVISEAPTFSGSLRTFRGKGAEIVSVSMDEQGLRTDELGATMQRVASAGRRVKLIYTIANFHNPTGLAMSLERRRELLRIAAEHGAFVLDDDAYGDLYFERPPPPALSAIAHGHGVITVGSFSKVIATGLRVGWVHARPELVELVARMRFDMGNSPLLHRALVHYLEDGRLDAHIERMRALYAEKVDILASALTELAEPYLTFQRPGGGFFLWVRLQQGLAAEALQHAATEEGVVFPLGRGFFADGQDTDGEHIRLAFSWTAKEDLRAGAERLARACARVAGGA